MKKYLSSLTSPEVFNPFKNARLGLEKPMQQIANEAGLSKQALIRTEQGTYDVPPERLIEYYLDHGHSYNELVNGYREFQVATRQRHHKIFGEPFGRFVYSGKHPLDYLLTICWSTADGTPVGPMNPTEFSKLMCVNQSVVDYFLSKPHRQKSVPGPILRALRDNGYSVDVLNDFALAYEQYRCAKLGVAVPRGKVSLLDEIRSELLVD